MSDFFDDFNDTPKPSLVFEDPVPEKKSDDAAPAGVETPETPASPETGSEEPAAPAAEPETPESSAPAPEAEASTEDIAASEHAEPAVPAAPAAAAAAAAAPAPAPAAPAAAEAPAEAQESQEEEPLSDSILSDEERAQVDAFSKKIDVRNTQAILQYGAGAQKKMADFSERALQNVKTKDLGEVGDMIAGLVTELKGFSTEEKDKGIFGFFKKPVDKVAMMKTKYDKTVVNVDKICKALEDHQVQLIRDIAVLDKMYELNLSYLKELTMYILAGKKRLKEVREGELAELTRKAKESGLAEDAQAAKDLDALCERFEKKLYDLELTRAVALQTAPQIRLIQDSDEVMVEKIQSTLVNTIPLWKNQMVIALGLAHSTQAAKAQREVTQVTNELLKKNAEALKQATVETAKEAERGIVEIETLRQTNATLISTLDEVLKIQAEGKAKRAAAEAEMGRMEHQLRDKLIQMSRD